MMVLSDEDADSVSTYDKDYIKIRSCVENFIQLYNFFDIKVILKHNTTKLNQLH